MAASESKCENSRAVLVVDDDADICDVLTDTLGEADYEVFVAPDGTSALAWLLFQPRPLVVLLDWRMPDIDGIAVLRTAAACAPEGRRHVYLLLTASEGEARPLLAGLPEDLSVTLVGKPFDVDDLLARVEHAARQLAARLSAPPPVSLS